MKRYTADKNIVDVIARHGNYLDDILDWDYVENEKQYYLASSFKLLDKIDITEVVGQIFGGKQFKRDGVGYTIQYSMWYAFNGDRQERPGDYRTSESRYGAETDDSRGTDYPPGNQ